MTKVFIIGFLLIAPILRAQSEYYNGFSGGLDIGRQYLFGGAQVDGVETIGDGAAYHVGGMLAWRKPFATILNFGIEINLNQPFGRFKNTANPDGTVVDYKIRYQTAVQFQFGISIGPEQRGLLFAYFAFNQTRFNIDITRPMGHFKQTDFENFGRIGIGYEYLFHQRLSGRAMIGTSMDALPGTNNGLDTKLGLMYHI